MTTFKKPILSTENLYFVADIGANHDGQIDRAYKLIELAKTSGANAAKFQNFKANKIVSDYGFRNLTGSSTHQSSWRKSVFETYADASIADEWTERLKKKCDEFEIDYFTSPYDFDSVDHADRFVNLFKIGSGDITWTEMIEYIGSKGKPVLLATGAANMEDVHRAMATLLKVNKQVCLMQCNTNYMPNNEKIRYTNLNVLNTYRELYPGIILGLSDHSIGHATVCGAVALGARVIEKHFTDDNNREGPDHKFAMNPISWQTMVQTAQEVLDSLGDGIKRVEPNELESRIVQQRGLYAKRALEAGSIVSASDFEALRPCPDNAVRPYSIGEIAGRVLKRSLQSGELLTQDSIT